MVREWVGMSPTPGHRNTNLCSRHLGMHCSPLLASPSAGRGFAFPHTPPPPQLIHLQCDIILRITFLYHNCCHPATHLLIPHTLSMLGDETLVRWVKTWRLGLHINTSSWGPLQYTHARTHTHTSPSVSEILSSEGSEGPKASSTNTQAVKNLVLPFQDTARILGWGQRNIIQSKGDCEEEKGEGELRKVCKAAIGGGSFKDRTQVEM